MSSLRDKIGINLSAAAARLKPPSRGTNKSKMNATMRGDKFNEHGHFGGVHVPYVDTNPEGYTSSDNGITSYAKKHRSGIVNKKEYHSAKPTGKHSKKHPGFASVQHKIEGEGYSHKIAGAILAHASRHASKAAHKANPRLNRVKG